MAKASRVGLALSEETLTETALYEMAMAHELDGKVAISLATSRRRLSMAETGSTQSAPLLTLLNAPTVAAYTAGPGFGTRRDDLPSGRNSLPPRASAAITRGGAAGATVHWKRGLPLMAHAGLRFTVRRRA
jgi:hypothetical protein